MRKIYSFLAWVYLITISLPLVAIFLMSIFCLVIQIYNWASEGNWKSISTKDILNKFGIIGKHQPIIDGWVGLNSVAEWILDIHPLILTSALAMLVVALTLWLGEQIEDYFSEKEKLRPNRGLAGESEDYITKKKKLSLDRELKTNPIQKANQII